MELRPRLLFVTNSLATGGAEKQLLLILRGLTRAGYACTLLCLDKTKLDESSAHGLLFRALSEGNSVQMLHVKSWGFWRFLYTFCMCPIWGSPIVWTWGYRADMMALLLRLAPVNSTTIVSLRSANAEKIRRLRWLWWIIGAAAERFLANSRRNIDLLAEFLPDVNRRARVVYNALDHAVTTRDPIALPEELREMRVVMLGNIRQHAKGYDYLIPLGRRLREEKLPIRIFIGGADYEQGALARALTENHLEDTVRIVGHIADVDRFLRSGHVYLLMSRYEGQPNALLEAMAIGLPCISTRVGDVTLFSRDGVHLRQVDVGDVNAVFRILKEFLASWPNPRLLGESARGLCVQEFSVAKMESSVLAEIRGLTARPAAVI